MNNSLSLSEAIRFGSTLRPQAREMYFKDELGHVCSCALGAAWEAVTGKTIMPEVQYCLGEKMYQRFPLLMSELNPADLPLGCNPVAPSLYNAIAYLNDYCGWSREQIADFVEGLEAIQ